MPIPFWCPQDALFDLVRWNTKKVRFREATFLANENAPSALTAHAVRVVVGGGGDGGDAAGGDAAGGDGDDGVAAAPRLHVPAGTAMDEVGRRVRAAHPAVRLIEIGVHDVKRLCKWLGSAGANRAFNRLARYVLTDSSRYCPTEDHRGFGGWDWRNPFTAYNCTWGFHYPTPYSESPPCGDAHGGSRVAERTNSTTCPRQMLCDFNTREDGGITRPITFCNIEGYGGIRPKYKPAIDAMLARMPGGRCPYPPGDGPGMPGFDAGGHYVGRGSNGIYEQYVRKHRG